MSVLSTHSRRAFERVREQRSGTLVVAHGSRDPRAAGVAHQVAESLSRKGGPAHAAFLELCEPDPDTALSALVEQGVTSVAVVPFLLGHAYHAKVDLPEVAASCAARGLDARVTQVLGPDPLLASAVTRRIAELGAHFDAVVLAGAGSSDAEGNAGVARTAEQLDRRLGVPVIPGFATAATPGIAEAVRRARSYGAVLVATYLLASGYFADTIRSEAFQAGASAVTAPLGSAPEVVERVSVLARRG